MKIKKLKIVKFSSTSLLANAISVRGGLREKMSHSTSGKTDWADNCNGKWDDVRWYDDRTQW